MLSLAAEMLRKGGTLLSEACEVCNGVQVKFEDHIICVNCNKKIRADEHKEEEKQIERSMPDLHSVITQKINELIPILINEREITRQLDIAKLLNSYLEILRKIED
jgi:uncharacterized Zn finger protein (UPF0148 family)